MRANGLGRASGQSQFRLHPRELFPQLKCVLPKVCSSKVANLKRSDMENNLQTNVIRRSDQRTGGHRISQKNQLAYWTTIGMTAFAAGQSAYAQNTSAPPSASTNSVQHMNEVVVKGAPTISWA